MHENFNPETRNSAESIFSVQMSVNDRSAGMNGNYGDVLNFPIRAQEDVADFFNPPNTSSIILKQMPIRLTRLIHFNDSDVKSDEGYFLLNPFTPYNGPS